MQGRMGLAAPQELIPNTANTSPGEGQGAAQLWDPGWAQRRPRECKLSGCACVRVCHSFSTSAQHWQEQRELSDWGWGALREPLPPSRPGAPAPLTLVATAAGVGGGGQGKGRGHPAGSPELKHRRDPGNGEKALGKQKHSNSNKTPEKGWRPKSRRSHGKQRKETRRRETGQDSSHECEVQIIGRENRRSRSEEIII